MFKAFENFLKTYLISFNFFSNNIFTVISLLINFIIIIFIYIDLFLFF